MKLLTATSLAALATLFVAAPAHSADLSGRLYTPDDNPAGYAQPTYYNWTGPYVGFHGGFGWGEWKGPLSYDDNSEKVEEAIGPFDDSDQKIDFEDWFGGLQLGYNQHVTRHLVVGVEIDASIAGFEGRETFDPYPGSGIKGESDALWTIETEIDWLATFRGRAGYAFDRVFVYATGGLAIAGVSSDLTVRHGDANPNAWGSVDANHVGYAIGAGTEIALTDHITLGGEYLYIDLGEVDYDYLGTKTSGNGIHGTDRFDPDLELHTIKAKLNYRF